MEEAEHKLCHIHFMWNISSIITIALYGVAHLVTFLYSHIIYLIFFVYPFFVVKHLAATFTNNNHNQWY